MPKMARNRNALHDVLAQGASNRENIEREYVYFVLLSSSNREYELLPIV